MLKSAYLTILRPLLEYAAYVWDPYQEYLVYNIEKVQRCFARWVLSDYKCYSSVTEMLRSLGWPTLESRRYVCQQINSTAYNNIPSYSSHTDATILHNNTISN